MSASDPADFSVEARARRSEGTSADVIYRTVAAALRDRHPGGGVLLDVGCGSGNVWPYLRDRFESCIGIDLVRYDVFPGDREFVAANLDLTPWPIGDASGDVVISVETIEHLENPRAFMRELVRLTKPSGWVLVSMPNQLSLLSKMTLVLKNQFNAFQDSCYPAHITALIETDLRRMAAECGLCDVTVLYTGQGRVVFTPWHYPAWLSRLLPRALSDNVLLVARKPLSL